MTVIEAMIFFRQTETLGAGSRSNWQTQFVQALVLDMAFNFTACSVPLVASPQNLKGSTKPL